MYDLLPGGQTMWFLFIALMLVILLALFGRSLWRSFSSGASARFDVTEIPADLPGSREFIVRDDKTGALLQFLTIQGHGRIVSVEVPARHRGTGTELELFEASLSAVPDIAWWTWPPTTPEGSVALRQLAQRRPELTFWDASGARIV
ncbi:hypothetical protein ELQ92_07565 [Labedella populi]|uniref:DUF2550 family protein n=1 Tax=Labedella populi TaxID=2498850 RepID=A0A3S4E6R8_9MICO|nr:hypothetical protein [Labedella populi]RWZ64601.1 hypothetical protein ELQ92_07565 [Labedella populi]